MTSHPGALFHQEWIYGWHLFLQEVQEVIYGKRITFWPGDKPFCWDVEDINSQAVAQFQ